jgi:MFS family permease
MITGPVMGRITDRIGARVPLTVGMLVCAASVLWLSFLQPDTGYGFIFAGFTAFGLGTGVVMTPMTTAAMNAVAEAKAGVASGVLNMSRMVGATLGVAVMGAVVQSTGQSDLYRRLPVTIPATLHPQLNALLSLGGGGGHAVPAPILEAIHAAFVYALRDGLRLCAALGLAGAVLAAVLVRGRPAETGASQPAEPRVVHVA